MKSIDGAVSRQVARPPLPESNVDVALVDLQDIKALIRLGDSWVHQAVKDGRFPAPVIRQHRCTRWKLSDVRAWLVTRAQAAPDSPETAAVRERQVHSMERARAARRTGREFATGAPA